MSTEPKYNYLSKSLQDTEKLGEQIASHITTPILIELSGDLGGGKTALVKAIASGLGIDKTVTSPTFNIHRSYLAASGITLEHFDLYRLSDDEIVQNELNDALQNEKAVVCVEWSQNFSVHAANNRIAIECHFINHSERRYILSATGEIASKIIGELNI